jgi:hypothetical protein
MSELVLRLASDATVRGTITFDGEQAFSVFNFINLMCNRHETFGNKVWERLTHKKSVYKEELDELSTKEFVNGLIGQDDQLSHTKKTRRSRTPVMTLRGLQRLLMILGGRVAAEFRQIVEGVFTRYMAGDRSMIEEICSNAVSDAPIHQAYRQALAQEPVLDVAGTKRQLELEMEERLVALDERKLALEQGKLALEQGKSRMPSELQEKSMQNVQTFAGLMTSLNPEWKSDARLRLQLEDSMKNAFFTPRQPLITNGEALVPLTRSIDVSTVGQDLGMRLKDGEAKAIGIKWKKKYTETYDKAPSLHDQFVNGAVRQVCSYTERDRPMGESVIREYFSTHPR